ncbi:MAG: hypothetical protein ACTHU0_21285 [Kofleriaceae bacterium]
MFASIRNSGFWTYLSVVLPEEFEEIDSRWPYVPDMLNGGSYAPLGPIEIGGQGVAISGPAVLQDIRDSTVSATCSLTFAANASLIIAEQAEVLINGTVVVDGTDGEGAVTFQDGAVLAIEASAGGLDIFGTATVRDDGLLQMDSGSTLNISDGALVSVNCDVYFTSSGSVELGGNTTFTNGTWPRLSGDRSWSRRTFVVRRSDGDATLDYRYVFCPIATSSGKITVLEFLDLPPNGTMTSVRLRTKGNQAANAGATYPDYRLIRWQDGDAAVEYLSAMTDDAHSTANWLSDKLDTTIIVAPVAPATAAIDRDYHYGVIIYHPWQSPDGQSMAIYEVEVNGTATEMRI